MSTLRLFAVVGALALGECAHEKPPPSEVVPVVIAKRTLSPGVYISAEDVTVRFLPRDLVTAGSAVFGRVEDVVCRIPQERILVNEVLRAARLADEQAGTGLNALIKPGMRAMRVRQSCEDWMDGFSALDVVFAMRLDEERWHVETILRDARVMAADTTGCPAGTVTVTLEMTPKEAQRVANARVSGEIHLVARRDLDITDTNTVSEVRPTVHECEKPLRNVMLSGELFEGEAHPR